LDEKLVKEYKGETMTPKERVRMTPHHEEPDRVPVGEYEIEFSVIEEALGRPTFYRAKAKYDMALWEGRRDEVVESLKVDAGIDVWQSIQPENKIEEVKQLYGRRITLWGGVRAAFFITGSPDDIRREARFAISRCSFGGGFILGSSHSIMVGAKYDNFMAMVETAKEH